MRLPIVSTAVECLYTHVLCSSCSLSQFWLLFHVASKLVVWVNVPVYAQTEVNTSMCGLCVQTDAWIQTFNHQDNPFRIQFCLGLCFPKGCALANTFVYVTLSAFKGSLVVSDVCLKVTLFECHFQIIAQYSMPIRCWNLSMSNYPFMMFVQS